MKKLLISKDNKGRIELNKLNRKGYYTLKTGKLKILILR